MKTNLIFKRPVTSNGVTKVVTRIIPVDIPMIDSGEGWVLSGHSDVIETCEDVYIHRLAPIVHNIPVASEQIHTDDSSYMTPIATVQKKDIVKFESDIPGTAKLVRSKGVIKIVARRGKSTYNQTTPNSICINDFTKNEFFKNCREKHGNTGIYEFKLADGDFYNYWNDVIDKEYQRQKNRYENSAVIE